MNLQRVNSEVGLLESDLELPNKHMPPWPMTVERADICMWRYVYEHYRTMKQVILLLTRMFLGIYS